MRPLLIEPAEPARLGIVAFHDAGTSPDQFRQAFSDWRPVLPSAVLYAPRAPMPCNPEVGGLTWYSLDGIDADNRTERLAEGAELARDLLKDFGQRYHLPPERIIAVGYSQGAVMLLSLAAEAGHALFGQLLSFVGQPLPDETPVSRRDDWPRVDLFHGEEDDVVPLAYANALFAWLSRHGADPTLFVERDTGHRLAGGAIHKAAERLREYVRSLD